MTTESALSKKFLEGSTNFAHKALGISIIIPTLNEASYLRHTVKHALSVADNKDHLELIVIDAGSNDCTLETIEDLHCTAISRPDFKLHKHESLNYGMEVAQHEIVLFLDADTLLPESFDFHILRALQQKGVVGGAFGMRFSDPDIKLWLLSMLNSCRYHLWKTFFGDQAIFCRKEVAIGVGGFPDSLMEAAHFCKSLLKEGKLRLLENKVSTSPRRFQENGFWKVLWFDVRMWIRFIFDLDLKKPKARYWKTNLQ